MRKLYLTSLLTFLVCVLYAQEPVEQVYWTGDVTNNEKVLNKTKFRDNWFAGIHGGSFVSWGSYGSHLSFWRHVRPAGAVSVGKWLAPFGGVRLQAVMGGNIGQTDPSVIDKSYTWHTVGGSIDGLFNLTNIVCKYKEDRLFNLIFIIGVGLENTYKFSKEGWYDQYPINTRSRNRASWRMGLQASFRLNSVLDLTVEAVNNILDGSYDGQHAKNRVDGHVNAFLGLNYRFKNFDGTRQFTFLRRDASTVNALNEEINAQRAKINELERRQAATRVEKQVVNLAHVTTLIAFTPKSSEINELQQLNVYTAAEALKKLGNDADLYITSSAKPVDTDLFVGRANAIRTMLIEKMNVPAGRIFMEKDPAVIQSLDADQNCVIVYINE